MRVQRWVRWLLLALVPGACIPDVKNDDPGVCTPGQSPQCHGAELQACGSDYQWEHLETCSGSCQDGACIDAGDGGSPGDGGAATPPSCAALPAFCGPAADESCCEAGLVPGGQLTRTDTLNGNTPQTFTLSPFRLDRFEVTVGRFRSFVQFVRGTGNQVAVGAGAQPGDAGTGWDAAWSASLPFSDAALQCSGAATWTPAPAGGEYLPMNCVNWFMAFGFCAWDGGRLPTEGEWEYAATVASNGVVSEYPWGSTPPTAALAVYCDQVPVMMTGECTAVNAPAHVVGVGSRSPGGDGPWKQADLAGSLWEWALDADTPYSSMCTKDCYAFPSMDGRRAIRGGAWDYSAYYLAGGLRTADMAMPNDMSKMGIRCARVP